MKTIQPVLQVGPFDQAANPVTPQDYRARLAEVQRLMQDQGWAGVVVFGTRAEYATLNFVSGYTPRLGDALLLVSQTGDPVLLAFEGKRMVDAGRQTTWLEAVEPVGDLGRQVGEWAAALGQGTLATCHFDALNHAYHAELSAVPGLKNPADATPMLLELQRQYFAPESDSVMNAVNALRDAEAAVSHALTERLGARQIALSAEAAAIRHKPQDIRTLFSLDEGHTLWPLDNLPDEPAGKLTCYMAVRHWGGWVDGFFTVGQRSAVDQAAYAALDLAQEEVRPGRCPQELADGLRARGLRLTVERRNGLSPDLAPEYNGTLRSGDLCLVAVSGEGPGALCSSLVLVGEDEPQILWQAHG